MAIDLLKSVEGTEDALVRLCIRNSGWEGDRLTDLVTYHDDTYGAIVSTYSTVFTVICPVSMLLVYILHTEVLPHIRTKGLNIINSLGTNL